MDTDNQTGTPTISLADELIDYRYSPSFWQNVAVTMLILLGSAVQDSANGDDVYSAFATRMGLFVAVTLYAWGAVLMLDHWRNSWMVRFRPQQSPDPNS